MRCFHWFASVGLAVALAGHAAAQSGVPAAGVAPADASVAAGSERSVSEWLKRLHESAARRRAYIGTFVVSSSAGSMSSARIWHVCDGEQQMERVESLTGSPRSTFRHNDQVITFSPDTKTARTERRESLGLFPDLLAAADSSISAFYQAKPMGNERVAGVETEAVTLVPKDRLRYGYRVWTEKKTGLVVKLQTLDVEGNVLEQSAFSELQLDAPVRMDKLAGMMAQTDGYKVERAQLHKTTAAAEGWVIRQPVAGFRSMSCFKRSMAANAAADSTMQWVFSDGLASVSLFVEAYDRQRHTQEGGMAVGATQTLTRRLPDKSGDWWLTAVGEVPAGTLKAFASALERRR